MPYGSPALHDNFTSNLSIVGLLLDPSIVPFHLLVQFHLYFLLYNLNPFGLLLLRHCGDRHEGLGY